jgi:hypothetical protein
MSARSLSDEQLARVLREHIPARASSGLEERVLGAVEGTAQHSRPPRMVAPLFDADAPAGRRMVLLVAALLIAALATTAVIGAGRLLERELLPPLPGEFPWHASRQLEDWPGAVRTEPNPKLVQPLGVRLDRTTFQDEVESTDPGVPADVDLVEVTVRECQWSTDSRCVSFTPQIGPSAMPGPEDRWLAYGIVVDDDGDGVADYRYGVDNAGPPRFDRIWRGDLAIGTSSIPRFDRMWRTNLETGATDAYVDTLEDPLVMDAAFPGPGAANAGGGGHIFVVPTGDSFRVYAWAAAIVDGHVVATDYAPDAGWIEVTTTIRSQ